MAPAALLLLAACGGGEGNGGFAPNTPPTGNEPPPTFGGDNGTEDDGSGFREGEQPDPANFTAENARMITATTYVAAELARQLVRLGEDPLTGTGLDGGIVPQARPASVQRTPQTNFEVNEAVRCVNGGHVTFDFQAPDDDTRFEVGETLEADFDDCGLATVTVDGRATLALRQLSGTPSAVGDDWRFTLTGETTELTLEDGRNHTVTIRDSQWRAEVIENTGAGRRTRRLELPEGRVTFDAKSNRALELDPLDTAPVTLQATERRNGPSETDVDFHVRVIAPFLGGRFIAEVTEDFTGLTGEDPRRGTLSLASEDGSRITFTASPGGLLTLTTDSNGDNDLQDPEDGEETPTWRQFRAAAEAF
jgi:hypothetical protein